MATLDPPGPDSFLLQPWSSFVAKLRLVDNCLENSDQQRYCLGEAVSLKQEMLSYSQFPALEDFCLVVCHICNQVVTPQGILTHYEKRHSSPAPSRTLPVPVKPRGPALVAQAVAPGPPGDSPAFRVPKEYPHSRFSKAPLAVYPPKGARNKTCVSLPVVSLEKMPCLGRGESASHVRLSGSAPSSLKSASPASHWPGEKLVNGRGVSSTSPSSLPSPARSPLDKRTPSTPSPSPLDRKPSPSTPMTSSMTSSSPAEKKHQNGTKTPTSRSQKRLSGRVFDPNKHCGVQDPETKRPCTRSLTCKTHSLTHRRAVTGRRKNFDILLAEHKNRAKNEGEKEKEKEKEKDGGKEGGVTSQETPSPSMPHCTNGRPISTLKLRLANAHIPRVPGSSSPLPPPAPTPTPTPALTSDPSPHSVLVDGRLSVSSDEGDAESPEDNDKPTVHFNSRHPQPLGFCVFSSRLMGRGHYVFDRRWDKMRLALQNTVEKHLNAQMWRKVPLAAESLLSLSSSSSSSSGSPPPTSSLLSSSSSTFPQPSSKSRNGRTAKDLEESAVGSKRRKVSSSSSSSSSSSFSPSALCPPGDGVRRNGSSFLPALQGSGGGVRRTGSGLWSGGKWLHRNDGNHNALNSREHVVSSVSYSPIMESSSSSSSSSSLHPPPPLAPPSAPPLVFGGGAEGRKRRSPASFRGRSSKLSRPGGLFGNGDGVGILESPRQTKLHH